MCPIFTIAILLFAVWDIITTGFRLLPLPYFPGPAGVLQSLINDRALLFDSTWHSLVLLLVRIFVRRYRRFDQRSLHRLVFIDALLGDAGLENHRANSGNRLDSARHGCLALGCLFRGRTDRARGLVSGHDADGVRNFQYARFVSRRRAHARGAAAAILSFASRSRPRFQIFSSVSSWDWARRF